MVCASGGVFTNSQGKKEAEGQCSDGDQPFRAHAGKHASITDEGLRVHDWSYVGWVIILRLGT